MSAKLDKAEPKEEENLSVSFSKLKGFDYNERTKTLVISVPNSTNFYAALKIIVPMLLVPIIIFLILALTETVVWSVLYFVFAVVLITFFIATFAFLFNRQPSKYIVSHSSVYRSVSGMTREANYGDIKKIIPRRSLFLKNGGSIHFKLYKGSGINLEIFLLKGFKETCGLISEFWLSGKAEREIGREFVRLFSNDDFADLLSFVNHDSAQIDKLPNCYRVFYIMWTLYYDLSGSDFGEFFINSPEITESQLLQACELLNLPELTDICERAVALNEEYDIANNHDLPDGVSDELYVLSDEIVHLDAVYQLENRFRQYFVVNYEKFDFGIGKI